MTTPGPRRATRKKGAPPVRPADAAAVSAAAASTCCRSIRYTKADDMAAEENDVLILGSGQFRRIGAKNLNQKGHSRQIVKSLAECRFRLQLVSKAGDQES